MSRHMDYNTRLEMDSFLKAACRVNDKAKVVYHDRSLKDGKVGTKFGVADHVVRHHRKALFEREVAAVIRAMAGVAKVKPQQAELPLGQPDDRLVKSVNRVAARLDEMQRRLDAMQLLMGQLLDAIHELPMAGNGRILINGTT